MDPLATAAEIATILQAAEAVPHLQRRRASRKERQEAYLTYQHRVHQLMTNVNHLSILAQLKTTGWQTSVIAALPMIRPFIEATMPKESTKHAFVGALRGSLWNIASFTDATSPAVAPILATMYAGENQFRDRVIIGTEAANCAIAEYLTALARVRLIGRPQAVEAAEVILVLLQKLFGSIPTRDDRPFYVRFLVGSEKKRARELRQFGNNMTAMGKANAQFMSAMRADRSGRRYSWQVWRRSPSKVRSASQLLIEVGKASDGSTAKS